ncbi:hypothetical protein EV424DRAFT_1476780 [Suillus variegatus]|nr:hypothetical protein EV424DRAFT_1476780 [Suillus variegatus]
MWIEHHSLFLEELLQMEGRGGLQEVPCSDCSGSSPNYQCQDCFGIGLRCSACITAAHQRHPLHRLQKWNGSYFERVTLKSLGLRIQLGHTFGQKCPNPRRAFNDNFVVMDSYGIDEVLLDFCDCVEAESHTQQLLRIAWFPSTTADPKTAATFRLLEEFHLLSFELKVSAYEFYSALVRRTNNTGLAPVKMLKRSGRGHYPNGGDTTEEACPHPGKNLPDDWEKAPRVKRWIYALFVAIHANFRLKRKIVSSNTMDPSLIEEGTYKENLLCSSHNAVNMADMKTSRGLAATGLGTIDCAHHNMKCPNAVGDLQKGEKYVNMDYLFFSTLRHTSIQTLNISYDIACQWHKKLQQRMSAFPISMRFDFVSKVINFFVPKFHLPAHIEKCQTTFSFNFNTKEMGPGARRDTLDDFFGDWNWKKVVGLSTIMLRKMKEALPERANQQTALNDLAEGLKEDYGGILDQWRTQVEAWEDDPLQPNPFERNADVITLASVRLALAKEDEMEIQSGSCLALHEDCSPSVLISSGLELEEQQRHLRADKAGCGLHATDTQQGKLVERSNALQRRIEAWVKIQALYMPNISAMRLSDQATSTNTTSVPSSETFKLWLPSQIGRSAPCDERLQRTEWRLRFAQGHDALRSLRSSLRAQTAVLKYKDHNLRGQGANTRARSTLKTIDARIEAAASRYECAHKALVILGGLLGEAGWQSSLRPLNWQDIRSMSDLLWGESEGRRKLSWIWNMCGTHDTTKSFLLTDSAADMRIEWCKARARAMRWGEEAAHWDERQDSVIPTSLEHQDGCVAYAKCQAFLCRELAASFEAHWAEILAQSENIQDID